jgi:hypothetical protein
MMFLILTEKKKINFFMKDDKISKENEFQSFYGQTYVNTSD